ncbi:universal stress protein, partial [Burkholderia pseudomallei]
FCENVLVAWEGSREAARGVAVALPLLKRATFLTVESVLRRRATGAGLATGGFDVAAYVGGLGFLASFSASALVPGVDSGAALLN